MSLGARGHANRRRSAAIDLWRRGPDHARRYDEGPRAAVVGDPAHGARVRVYLPRRHLAFPSARAEAAREAHGAVCVEEESQWAAGLAPAPDTVWRAAVRTRAVEEGAEGARRRYSACRAQDLRRHVVAAHQLSAFAAGHQAEERACKNGCETEEELG